MAKDERKLVIDAGHAVLVLQDNGDALIVRWFNITACAARRAAAALEARPEPEPVPGPIGVPGPVGATVTNESNFLSSNRSKGTP